MITAFTTLALVVLAGLTVFQVALICGAPIGRFAWGGQHDRLPTKLRIGSATSILIYTVVAAAIAVKAGFLTLPLSDTLLTTVMWTFTIYFFVGIGMNAISKSKPERAVMTPAAALLAVSFLVVTLG